MTILYFTATGNSLFVAKQFEGEQISIPQAIKHGEYVFEDTEIGVVCPVYCNMPPKIVLDFLKKATIKAEYKFLILTYGNMNFGAAGFAAELCREHKFDYIQTVHMVDNYLPMFDMEKERAANKKVDEQLAKILQSVQNRERLVPKLSKFDKSKNSMAQEFFAKKPQFNDGSQIAVTEKCVGCGICAKVCPIGNFYIEKGFAKRKSETCEFCLACANLCTNKAIICGLADKNPDARYKNENVSLCEIIKANNQNGIKQEERK